MKIRVSHSESIQISEGHWKKDEIDVELNEEFDGRFPEHDVHKNIENFANYLREKIVEIIKSWQVPVVTNYNGQPIAQQAIQPAVIDRSIERLEIMIDDCKTARELIEIFSEYSSKITTNNALADLYVNKTKSFATN